MPDHGPRSPRSAETLVFDDAIVAARDTARPRDERLSLLCRLGWTHLEGDDRRRFDELVVELWDRGEKHLLDEAEVDYCRVFGP